ncbi:MAG TPA: hypothetical protein VFG69_17045 [Nannocystaceae bacterium]|nr:hypothetical protein [Nannocystaceae bacterium]
MKLRQHPTFALGFGLVALLVVQDVYGLEIPALEELQRDGMWKLATGSALVAFLAFQWALAAIRMRGSSGAGKHLRWHRCVGALGPVLFYAHATKFGYAYLAALSSVFLGNILLGAAAPVLQRLRVPWIRLGWPVLHIAASVLTLVLTAIHAVVAAYYE